MAFDKEKYESSEYRNDWALDVNHDHIHISKAKSGANGYFCLGCDKEMQACKGEKVEHYFRHHIKDVNKEKIECVVASRKYREQLAASILNRLKYVKVPSLYKYPKNIEEGAPMLLEKSKIIKASYTKSELTFYEGDDGVIHWGANKEVEERHLLIRPDVTFFDKKDKPILFIEFVIHHKPDLEKRNKLKRLGIDAVQIIIPKLTSPEIEKAIKSVSKYKWLYNELEANTQYIPVPKSNTETIQPIDEEQVKLIRESFECKSAEIKQLINSIENCLRTERFKTARRTFELEISRVKENTKREREELGNLEESNRREALGRNSQQEDQITERHQHLGTRYEQKRTKLRQAIYATELELQSREQIKKSISRIENRRKELERVKSNHKKEIERAISEEFSQTFERERAEITRIGKNIENIDEEIRNTINRDIRIIQWDIEDFGVRYRNLSSSIYQQYRREIEIEESEIDSIDRETRFVGEELSTVENDVRAYFREAEETERREYQEEINRIEREIEEIEDEERNFEKTVREQFDRDIKSNPKQFTEELRVLLESKRVLNDYIKTECEEIKYKRLQELFKKGVGL